MNKKQRKMLWRIIASALLMIILHVIPIIPSDGVARFALYMIPYFIIGYDILKKAFIGIWKRQLFDESFLMAVATVGAIVIGLIDTGDYTEAVAVMLFYQIGELFQSYAVGKSRKSITDLMDIRPDIANVETDGIVCEKDPEEVEVGSIIIVRPGEKVPIDGIVVEGASTLDTTALTGESLPRTIERGDEITSGCVNLTGVIKIRTTKEFGESTVAKILDLVENASFNKAKSEDFIAKFARVYTPAVCISALIIALLPPVISGMVIGNFQWNVWLYRALTFLVVSCPCALVISIPLTFFAGIGGASRNGILIKGSNFIETLADVSVIAFDKTGTLTKGAFEVTNIYSADGNADKLLEYAAYTESYSMHPISGSIVAKYGMPIDETRVKNVCEISGRGVTAEVDGDRVVVGNAKLMEEQKIDCKRCDDIGTIVYVAVNERFAGCIVIADVLKESSVDALKNLKKISVKKCVMLTGDNLQIAEKTANKLEIDEVCAELMPADKVKKAEELIADKDKIKGAVAFVGDGINDAPVLTRVDVGVAMGGIGSDAAMEAADVVLMDDDLTKLVKAIKISRKCIRIVRQNCIFAIGIKLMCLLLAAVGIANMWLAIFADVGVMVLAVMNAVRAYG